MNNEFEHRIRQWPKAELHVHLEGSMGMGTLNRLRERRGEERLQKSPYVFNNFETFNAVFLFISDYLKDEEDFHIMFILWPPTSWPGTQQTLLRNRSDGHR